MARLRNAEPRNECRLKSVKQTSPDGEQVARGEMGYQRSDRVNEPWLVRERYRLSSIPGGSGRDLDAFCFERNQGGCERVGGRAEPRTGQIAADTDQDQFVSYTLRPA